MIRMVLFLFLKSNLNTRNMMPYHSIRWINTQWLLLVYAIYWITENCLDLDPIETRLFIRNYCIHLCHIAGWGTNNEARPCWSLTSRARRPWSTSSKLGMDAESRKCFFSKKLPASFFSNRADVREKLKERTSSRIRHLLTQVPLKFEPEL